MRLSDFCNIGIDIVIYRDGEFEDLDFTNSKLKSKVLTFVDDEKYISSLSENITCIICTNKISKILPDKYGICVSDTPRLKFYLLHNYLSTNLNEKNNFETIIGENCIIKNSCNISDDNVVIGNNVRIEENVIIRGNVHIGDNVIIRSGAIIGGEGFQFSKSEEIFFIEHSGGVRIGKNVEIQYNTCIDKAMFSWDNTIIEDGTKVDNLVYIGHGAKIGKRCLIAANASIAGSTVVGNDCWIGMGATLSNGLTIGNNVSIKIGAVVTKDITDGVSVSGNFAIEHDKFIRFIKNISRKY